jgi:hypothetical protein
VLAPCYSLPFILKDKVTIIIAVISFLWLDRQLGAAIPNSDFEHGVLGISGWVLAISEQ